MDRDRLKEVHQTDLTESRLNEDFVDWLKNKGPTWLLVCLLAICTYLGVDRFRQHRSSQQFEAWAAFFAAQLPGSLEDVALEYSDIGRLASVARLRAADQLLRSIETGLALGAAVPPDPDQVGIPPDPRQRLTAEDRDQYLTRADGLFARVLTEDDGSLDLTLFVVTAMNGRATVAECRGDADAARDWYGRAAARAESFYPGLARQAEIRAASVLAGEVVIAFPSREEVAAAGGVPPARRPVSIDDALRDLVLPE